MRTDYTKMTNNELATLLEEQFDLGDVHAVVDAVLLTTVAKRLRILTSAVHQPLSY